MIKITPPYSTELNYWDGQKLVPIQISQSVDSETGIYAFYDNGIVISTLIERGFYEEADESLNAWIARFQLIREEQSIRTSTTDGRGYDRVRMSLLQLMDLFLNYKQ